MVSSSLPPCPCFGQIQRQRQGKGQEGKGREGKGGHREREGKRGEEGRGGSAPKGPLDTEADAEGGRAHRDHHTNTWNERPHTEVKMSINMTDKGKIIVSTNLK